ncbi:hypothetical protein [Niabella soli]|uniref:Uncharacterized protein n=1 Tax=Niabella soli DSM 19437 TaxID=929713 RepID=W0F883_9BACT|nr:hypothetical protein [Niabella soli]AHF18033.1 hypothetical protein NIASO_19110 [Niabella soli DSM 19437]
MRLVYDDIINQPKDARSAFINMNISFTGDAISHLAENGNSFNIKEWVWHIEIIEGRECYIVTDKKAEGATN